MEEKIVSVIDDDQVYQFVTKKIIEQQGIKNILQFYDGEQGIRYIKSNIDSTGKLPHLILLDINMPYLNGWQFLDELLVLELGDYKPVIYIVSSSSSKEDLEKAEGYSILSGFRVKPINREKFQALLNEMNMN
jgi:two-component system, chemotaxis family, chemotaxis protein CheY